MNGSSNGDAAAGAAATAAAGAPASAAEAFKEQGNAQFRAGQYLKAAALYTQALKADPGNAVLYRCGRGARQAGAAALWGLACPAPLSRQVSTWLGGKERQLVQLVACWQSSPASCWALTTHRVPRSARLPPAPQQPQRGAAGAEQDEQGAQRRGAVHCAAP